MWQKVANTGGERFPHSRVSYLIKFHPPFALGARVQYTSSMQHWAYASRLRMGAVSFQISFLLGPSLCVGGTHISSRCSRSSSSWG